MGSQLLQNTEIIKQTDYFGKSEENTDLSCIYKVAVKMFKKNILYKRYNFEPFCVLPIREDV